MALIFRNPVLSRLEDLLWEKARQRYVAGGGNPFDDVRELPESARAQVSSWVKTWQSEERKKLKVGLSEYKRIVAGRVTKALKSVIEVSHADWYSVEVKDSIYAVVLAVPLSILRHKTREVLPPLLQEPIPLQNLSAESIAALADVAISEYFNESVKSLIAQRAEMEVQGAFRPAIVADIIKDDYYHFDTRSEVLREDMVILHTFVSESKAKDNEKVKKRARKEWVARRKNPDSRPNSRRFDGTKWSVPASLLSGLGHP